MKPRVADFGICACVIPALIPALAIAQPVTGPYVNLGAGVDFLQDQSVQPDGTSGLLRRSFTFAPGFAATAGVGYGFGNGLRVELEGDFASNQVHGVRLAGPARAGGTEDQYGGFFNTLYDFSLDGPVSPYLGVGLGYQQVELDHLNAGPFGIPVRSGTGSAGGFAYQGIAGVSYPLTLMPGLSVTAEYRLIGVVSPPPFDHGISFGTAPPSATPQTTRATVSNIFNHEATVGLRYAFNTAPPAPPPVEAEATPAPAAARTYLVFFDWDRSDLTDRARQIIAEAAQASTRVQTTRIQVNGYTDASGEPAYNQRLSVRRGEVVAAELVRDGVPRNAISIEGFGENNPLVPTAKGVKEPQNRRVEVILK